MNISILKPESIVNEVFALYEKYGKRKVTDQELSQLEQVSQAAALAEEEGYEDEVILAAFFHNAGEILGTDYLREHGFSERLAALVESDLQATRYLAYKYPEYYDQLPESEKADLETRGGKMIKEEADKFELDPDAELFVRLRYLNDKAKDTRKYKLNIPHIKLLAMSHLYKIMDKYLPAFLMSKSSIQPRIG
ncbi:phosphohydrolase [Mucilaginibacter sp. BT774]|uniref:phosphohydrolase n=1 Tax=Mucilaginibacter sp. BT774 TaxID=3062276 RepID=UPI002676DBC8|nr:phosphohydrolase [Mucilaginibacter sp. BT774]MDO3627832.1 phosphohydrolase [Mucilaginibacter sp. BT774]